MHVSVIGTGYVGLVSGVCLAEKGHHVTCVDIDCEKVAAINKGRSPIHEERLDDLLQQNVGSSFVATTDVKAAVQETELSLLCVGTPFNGARIDLSQIEGAAESVGDVLRKKEEYHAVVVKSTVVPGTTDGLVRRTLEHASGKQAGDDFGLGMNPEFLREGQAVMDFMDPDRIVLGGLDARTHDALETLYAPFGGVDKMRTSNRTAELVKYASNALLATLISFSNEIGNLAAALDDIDIVDVMRGVHLDKRFSPIRPDGSRIKPGFLSYLAAGCGFGGSCFPKDVRALIAHGREAHMPMRILDAVVETNEQQPLQMLQLLRKRLPELDDKRVAVLGLAFKPGTDDVRESPAIPIIQRLQERGAHVQAYDPIATDNARAVLDAQHLTFCPDLETALQGIDAVLLITSWPEFEQLPELLEGRAPQPVVVDGRRMLDPESVARYESIGR